ncbi:MAG: hypothetical protein JOZ54_19980 [Acidobacteria bacterium]|nr:hypothetical protein [Acidobacteriota bacterium]
MATRKQIDAGIGERYRMRPSKSAAWECQVRVQRRGPNSHLRLTARTTARIAIRRIGAVQRYWMWLMARSLIGGSLVFLASWYIARVMLHL